MAGVRISAVNVPKYTVICVFLRLYIPHLCQTLCKFAKILTQRLLCCVGTCFTHVQAFDNVPVQSATQWSVSLNRQKKTSSFSGLHPHRPLLLHQWVNGRCAPMCCEERVHQRLYTSCQSCFETVQMTPKKAPEIVMGTKKPRNTVKGTKYTK